MTLPDGFEPRRQGWALEAAAKDAGWSIERRGAIVAVRDVWTENEDHAAWLVATKAGLFARARDRLGGARPIAAVATPGPY